jgi:short-subunit dehydrogenase
MILIGSLAATAGSYPVEAYCGAKAFEMRLAEGMWSSLRGTGVDVLYELIGAVETPNMIAAREAVKGTDRQKRDNERTPIDFPYPPDEIVQYCFDHLPEEKGPVHCPEELITFYEQCTTTDREKAIDVMARMLRI